MRENGEGEGKKAAELSWHISEKTCQTQLSINTGKCLLRNCKSQEIKCSIKSTITMDLPHISYCVNNFLSLSPSGLRNFVFQLDVYVILNTPPSTGKKRLAKTPVVNESERMTYIYTLFRCKDWTHFFFS